MGVTSGSNVLYTMFDVRLPHLFMIAVDRAKRHSRQDPVIVVDFSWLCFKCGGDTDTPPTAFRKVAANLLLLLDTGFVVHVVLDPPHRHHSKKATVARNVAAHRATIGAIKAKSEILSLTKSIRDNLWDTVEERTELENRLKDLERAANKYERISRGRLSAGFVTTMECLLFELCDKTTNLSCSVAPYQADAKICYMCMGGKADLVFGNDSDFAFVIGPGCVQMTEMRLTSKDCILKIPWAHGPCGWEQSQTLNILKGVVCWKLRNNSSKKTPLPICHSPTSWTRATGASCLLGGLEGSCCCSPSLPRVTGSSAVKRCYNQRLLPVTDLPMKEQSEL
jgi:hypothetical protein